MLNEGNTILDFGCGSGRDTKYFLEKGYSHYYNGWIVGGVRSIGLFAGTEVREMLFQELRGICRHMTESGPVPRFCICKRRIVIGLSKCAMH